MADLFLFTIGTNDRNCQIKFYFKTRMVRKAFLSSALKLNEVFIETFKNNGRIILNRPDDNNTVSISMVNQIFPVLKQWQDTKSFVIVKSVDSNCSGNDTRGLVEAELRGETYAKKFYQIGLSMNALIANYKIPIVSLIAGSGLTVHAEFSVATEKSIFSMPNCSLGFVPDMGATYVLPRLPGHLGKFLALTGYKIMGRNLQRINLATHYCPSNRLEALENDLTDASHDEIVPILRKYEPKDKDQFILTPILSEIDDCFGDNTIEGIMRRLRGNNNKWALEALDKLEFNSPMSLKVTLEALKRGKKLNLRDCLNMEYHMALMAIAHKDLYEGVRANLIDGDMNPSWRPATIHEVTDEHVRAFFPKVQTNPII